MSAMSLSPCLLRVCAVSVLLGVVPGQEPAAGQDPRADYEKLAVELEVRELSTLMFAKYDDANLLKIEGFLQRHPDAPEREKVLYLRAYSLWSLHRYDDAPAAYAALLAEFPRTRFRRIARIREAAAYLFSGQADKALPRLLALKNDHPDRPEVYARELAYALSRCGQQDEAVEFMDSVEEQMIIEGKERLLSRIVSHFDKIRLVGKPLPVFTVEDHFTGDEISRETLRGKVALIDFWATWCGPCVAELPHILAAHRALAPEGFVVFSVSLDEDQERMEKMIEDREMSWLHHFDGKKWQNELAVAFDVHSIPASLLVDRKGVVRAVNLRGREVADLVKGLLEDE